MPPALDRAQQCVDRIFALNQESPYGVWLRGLVAFSGGELRKARPDLERAHRLLPDDPDVMVMLWYLLSLRGLHDRAEEMSARLLELDPLTPMNHGMPGFRHVMEGHPEESVPFYRRFHEMDPENPLGLPGQRVDLAAREADGRGRVVCRTPGGLQSDQPVLVDRTRGALGCPGRA